MSHQKEWNTPSLAYSCQVTVESVCCSPCSPWRTVMPSLATELCCGLMWHCVSRPRAAPSCLSLVPQSSGPKTVLHQSTWGRECQSRWGQSLCGCRASCCLDPWKMLGTVVHAGFLGSGLVTFFSYVLASDNQEPTFLFTCCWIHNYIEDGLRVLAKNHDSYSPREALMGERIFPFKKFRDRQRAMVTSKFHNLLVWDP